MTPIDIKFTQIRLDFSQINNKKKLKEAVKKGNEEIKALKYLLLPQERSMKEKLLGVQQLILSAGSKEEYLANYLDAIEIFKINRNALNQHITQYNQANKHPMSLMNEVNFKTWKTYDGFNGLFWFVKEIRTKIASYLDFKDLSSLILVNRNFAKINKNNKNTCYTLIKNLNGIVFKPSILNSRKEFAKVIYVRLYHLLIEASQHKDFKQVLLPLVSQIFSQIKSEFMYFFAQLLLLKILRKNIDDPELEKLFYDPKFAIKSEMTIYLIPFLDPETPEKDFLEAATNMIEYIYNKIRMTSLQAYGF